MCSCDVATSPDAFVSGTRRARKQHRCCECRETIEPGATYQVISGIWDGEPGRYKTCLPCVAARDAFDRRPGSDCHAPLGDLFECVHELLEDARRDLFWDDVEDERFKRSTQWYRDVGVPMVVGFAAGEMFRERERSADWKARSGTRVLV